MSVVLNVKFYCYPVGTADFLKSFFSTIAYHLEDGVWGSKYPVIMNELYSGTLKHEHIEDAVVELDSIDLGLKKLTCNRVVWDFDDLSKRPPQGDSGISDVPDLSNYFITCDGVNLVRVLKVSFRRGIETNSDVKILNLGVEVARR